MKKSQLIIIASNILGPEAMLNHGFDWQLLPITIEKLKDAIDYSISMEFDWQKRINLWKEQGAVEQEVVVEPGVLIWLVELKDDAIDLTEKNELNLSILLQIAEKVSLQPAHIRYITHDYSLCAKELLLQLKNINPIHF